MPFGINCAQDIFQKKVDEAYKGLAGVTHMADDTIIHGSTIQELMANLSAMLQHTHEKGVKLNLDKVCVLYH